MASRPCSTGPGRCYRARPGGTILLADGTYPVGRTLVLASDGVTLRSASGQRERVILDDGGTLGELLTLRACSDATIADLTLQNVRWNGIKVDSTRGGQSTSDGLGDCSDRSSGFPG